jgi:hypothetical protein
LKIRLVNGKQKRFGTKFATTDQGTFLMILTRLLLFIQCILAARFLYITDVPSAPSFSKAKVNEKSNVVAYPTLRKIANSPTHSSKFADSTEVIQNYTKLARELTEEEKDLYLIKTKPLNVAHALELFVHEAWLYQQVYVEQVKVLKEMNTNPQDHAELAAHFAESGIDIGQLYFKARQAIAWSNVLVRFAGWITRRPREEDLIHLDRLFEIVFNLYSKDLDLALNDVIHLFLNVPEFFKLRDNSSFFTWLVIQVREICNPPSGQMQQKIWFHDNLTPSLHFFGAASHILLPFIHPRTKLRVAWNALHQPASPEEFNLLRNEVFKIVLAEKRDKPAFEKYEMAWDKLRFVKGYGIIADCADEHVTDEDLDNSFLDPFNYTWVHEFLHVKEGVRFPMKREKPKSKELSYKQKGSKSKGKKKKNMKKVKKVNRKEEPENTEDPYYAEWSDVQAYPPTFHLPSFICADVTDELPIHIKAIQLATIQSMEGNCSSVKVRWFWAHGKLHTVGFDTRLEKRRTLAVKVQAKNEAKSEDKKAEIDELSQQETETVAKVLRKPELDEKENPVRQTTEAGPSMPIPDDEVNSKYISIPADEVNTEKAEVSEEEEKVEENIDESSSLIQAEGKAEWEHYELAKKMEAQKQKVFKQQQADQENSKLRERVRNNMKPQIPASSSQVPTEVAHLDSDRLCLEFSDAHKVFLANKNVCSINAKGFRWHFDPSVVIKQKHMDFLCTLFGLMPGRSFLKYKKMVKVYWTIEMQLNKRSARMSQSSGTTAFKWSHQFLINNTKVSPVMMDVHPEHESSGFNHVQARALFNGGGFDPRFFSPQ